jgi:hypothetical protein
MGSPNRAVSIAGTIVVASMLAPASAEARVYLSQEQALRLAFGEGATIEREVFFLTGEQLSRARELAGKGVDFPSALLTRYRGSREGRLLGWAYFDTHPVRTLAETILVVVGEAGAIERVEVVAFLEPEDYLPKPRWLEQFTGRKLDRQLDLYRGIHGITGATLSARAVTDATRRVLALHEVLAASGPAKSGGSR